MIGITRLLNFAFRSLVLLIGISILWISVAQRYNEALIALVQPLLPSSIAIREFGAYILIQDSQMSAPVSVHGFTLHSGLILMAVLVLAVDGIGVFQRIGWLLAMGAVIFLLHVLGVTLLARGVSWASVGISPHISGQLVFSLFAIFWGLLPAIVGGAWCLVYWAPRTRAEVASLSP